MAVVDKDGISVRQSLESQLERTKKVERRAEIEADLALPPFPVALDYLWRAYNRIRARKGGGFSGPVPIEWPDIDAFARNSRMSLAPWEIEVIEALDDAYLQTKR